MPKPDQKKIQNGARKNPRKKQQPRRVLQRARQTFGIESILNEYRRLDERWLQMQYQAHLWAVLIATAMEVLMFFVLQTVEGAIQTTIPLYLLKYLLVPFLGNLLLATCSTLVLRSPRCNYRQRVYVVSLNLMISALLLYMVHGVFISLYMIFAVPMALTIVYGDSKLTTIVAGCSLGGRLLVDLLTYGPYHRDYLFHGQLSVADYSISMLLLAVFYGICMILIDIEKKKYAFTIRQRRRQIELKEESVTDTLTGVGNRKALREEFDRLHEKAGNRYTLVILDMDDFKGLNDLMGHSCGDQFLTLLGHVLQDYCGANGGVFRFGGDEFCVLLQDSSVEEARWTCELLQHEYTRAQKALACERTVTLSFGIAEHQHMETPSQLLERADHALYQAKQTKNAICVAAE